MSIFRPTIYKESVYDIPYEKLKKEGIHCLVFDLDNTLGRDNDIYCPEKSKKMILELKKDFLIVISSNNNKKRVQPYLDELNIDGISWSLKPIPLALSIIQKRYHLRKSEMCMIGDQMLTDILVGNSFRIKTILVDPLCKADSKSTTFNRKIENKIIHYYEKKGIFKRGNYYE